MTLRELIDEAPAVTPREPYGPSDVDLERYGWAAPEHLDGLESDDSFVENNHEAAVWLLTHRDEIIEELRRLRDLSE